MLGVIVCFPATVLHSIAGCAALVCGWIMNELLLQRGLKRRLLTRRQPQ